MTRPDAETKLRAQAHVVGLLNEVEAVLTGWVLQHEREKIDKLMSPLYELVDRDD
jgi:hypothetical protein